VNFIINVDIPNLRHRHLKPPSFWRLPDIA
jgi:hypothetical protein